MNQQIILEGAHSTDLMCQVFVTKQFDNSSFACQSPWNGLPLDSGMDYSSASLGESTVSMPSIQKQQILFYQIDKLGNKYWHFKKYGKTYWQIDGINWRI